MNFRLVKEMNFTVEIVLAKIEIGSSVLRGDVAVFKTGVDLHENEMSEIFFGLYQRGERMFDVRVERCRHYRGLIGCFANILF